MHQEVCRRPYPEPVQTLEYTEEQLTRDEVDALPGPTMLAFGTNWCGYCRAAHRHLAKALRQHPELRTVFVEDGRGRPLGRSFRVRLWPTLIFLDNGVEVARLVRPTSTSAIAESLSRIDPPRVAPDTAEGTNR